MLVNAMEVSGIEGNYRSVCEVVMMVLREQRDSVMAMLEAFVHDPLINWGLDEKGEKEEKEKAEKEQKEQKEEKGEEKTGASTGSDKKENSQNNTDTTDTTTGTTTGTAGTTGAAGTTGTGANSSNDNYSGGTSKNVNLENPEISNSSTNKFVPPKQMVQGSGMKRSKRASTKLSAQGGIIMPTVHDAVAKGDSVLALSLSCSGLAQSYKSKHMGTMGSLRSSLRSKKSR